MLINSVDYNVFAVWGINYFRFFEFWGRGFESHSRQESLCLFILFVLSCW
jgi:hypothetical protein